MPPATTQFTDPGKESAAIGFILAGRFLEIPPAFRIPSEAFTTPAFRIAYSAAGALDARGQPVCLESINDWIARHSLEKEMQVAVDSTGTVSWRAWSQEVDHSFEFVPPARSPTEPPGPVKWCLSELAQFYQAREEHWLKKQWFEETISEEEFNARRQRLHQANGAAAFDHTPYDELRFSEARLHEKPIPVFTLCGQNIATAGNMVAIYAQAKAGKSAVVSAMMAAIMTEVESGDFLGFSAAANSEGKAVIHFDTEQSRYDHEQVVLRAIRRAACNRAPAWLRSYCLTGLDIPARRAFIAKEMERAAAEHGGIFCVLVDGVGDFVPDVNDPAATHTFIVELHGLAMRYETSEILVLHENPGTGKNSIEKMRGHLGSQLERKVESNIRILKEKGGACVIYTEKSRHANIPKDKGHRFAWNETSQTHATLPAGEDPATEDDREVVREMFNCPEALGGLTWTQCHDRIAAIEGGKRAGARRQFRRYLKLKLIIKNPNAKELYIENHP